MPQLSFVSKIAKVVLISMSNPTVKMIFFQKKISIHFKEQMQFGTVQNTTDPSF